MKTVSGILWALVFSLFFWILLATLLCAGPVDDLKAQVDSLNAEIMRIASDSVAVRLDREYQADGTLAANGIRIVTHTIDSMWVRIDFPYFGADADTRTRFFEAKFSLYEAFGKDSVRDTDVAWRFAMRRDRAREAISVISNTLR